MSWNRIGPGPTRAPNTPLRHYSGTVTGRRSLSSQPTERLAVDIEADGPDRAHRRRGRSAPRGTKLNVLGQMVTAGVGVVGRGALSPRSGDTAWCRCRRSG